MLLYYAICWSYRFYQGMVNDRNNGTRMAGHRRVYHRRDRNKWMKDAGFWFSFVGSIFFVVTVVRKFEESHLNLPHSAASESHGPTIENFSSDSLDHQNDEEKDKIVEDTFYFHHGTPAFFEVTLGGKLTAFLQELQRISESAILHPPSLLFHGGRAIRPEAYFQTQRMLRQEEEEGFQTNSLRGKSHDESFIESIYRVPN